MIDFLQSISSWAAWLGIGGIVGFFLLMMFAPSLGKVAGEFLAPLARAFSEGIVWFFRDVLWVGMKDMLDNWASVTFVIVAILVGAWAISPRVNCEKQAQAAVAKAIYELRKDYKFVKRTPAEQKAWKQKNQPSSSWWRLW